MWKAQRKTPTPAKRHNAQAREVRLTIVTNDDRTQEAHLLTAMEAELVTTREELAKAAAHNADMEAELFDIAGRLTAKEAEHEAALNALRKLRDELFEERAKTGQAQQPAGARHTVLSHAKRLARKITSVDQQ